MVDPGCFQMFVMQFYVMSYIFLDIVYGIIFSYSSNFKENGILAFVH